MVDGDISVIAWKTATWRIHLKDTFVSEIRMKDQIILNICDKIKICASYYITLLITMTYISSLHYYWGCASCADLDNLVWFPSVSIYLSTYLHSTVHWSLPELNIILSFHKIKYLTSPSVPPTIRLSIHDDPLWLVMNCPSIQPAGSVLLHWCRYEQAFQTSRESVSSNLGINV